MKAIVPILQNATLPSRSQISAYLSSRSWRMVPSDLTTPWQTYRFGPVETEVALDVPLLDGARDFARTMATLIKDLAAIEGRTEAEVLRDIHAASMDIVRIRADGPLTADGRIPVEAGSGLFSACRDMVLAAACAAIEPKAVYPTKRPEEAMKVVRDARFGQTEIGSFVVTIEADVTPRVEQMLELDAEMIDPTAPMTRRTFETLARSLHHVRQAVEETVVGVTGNAFAQAVSRGVSANLCDAIAQSIEVTESNLLDVVVSFGQQRPLMGSSPLSVQFTNDARDILREAADSLRDKGSLPDTMLTGAVIRLSSEDPDSGGEIVIAALVDGKVKNVHMELPPKDYRIAHSAHGALDHLTCEGDLRKQGKAWRLIGARNVTVADPDGTTLPYQ